MRSWCTQKKERKKIISVILQNCEDTLQALVQSENFKQTTINFLQFVPRLLVPV